MSFYWHEEWWSPEDAEEIARWVSGEMHKELGTKQPIGMLHMSDADSAKAAKHLANLDRHMGEVVKILAAINENMVVVGRTFNAWLEGIEVEEETIEGVELNAEETGAERSIEFRTKRNKDGVPYDELVCTGLLKELPDGTYQIDVSCPGEDTNTWCLPPSGPWRLNILFDGWVYDFMVPSFDSGTDVVYGDLHE